MSAAISGKAQEQPEIDVSATVADRFEFCSVLGQSELHRGPIWRTVSETVQLADGQKVVREVVEHPGAVGIIAVNAAGEVLVQQQYRHAVGAYLWEPPAGLLDFAGENPLAAAQRELYEEADLQAAKWSVLVDSYASPGMSSEMLRIYLAEELSEVPPAERFHREAEEVNMPKRWLPLSEIVAGILAGKLSSPTLIMGALALQSAQVLAQAQGLQEVQVLPEAQNPLDVQTLPTAPLLPAQTAWRGRDNLALRFNWLSEK